MHLGYPQGNLCNDYYTAKVGKDYGVTVAYMIGDVAMVQFFPWPGVETNGHEVYAQFITDRASHIMAQKGELFTRWPFISESTGDLLMLKCLIEDGIQQVEKINADHQARAADPAAEKLWVIPVRL